MKVAMMVIGGILVLFGLVDLIGSYAGFDLWGVIGIQLPDVIWKYSSYIEIAAGYFLFKFGKSSDDNQSDTEVESA